MSSSRRAAWVRPSRTAKVAVEMIAGEGRPETVLSGCRAQQQVSRETTEHNPSTQGHQLHKEMQRKPKQAVHTTIGGCITHGAECFT